MELEDALFTWASGIVPITTLIGSPPATVRLYKGKIPQGSAQPCTVMQRSSAPREYRYCKRDGAVPISLQLDHYDTSFKGAKDLAAVWRAALNPDPTPYPTWFGAPNVFEGCRVKGVFLLDEFDRDVPEPGLMPRTQLWRIWVWEP